MFKKLVPRSLSPKWPTDRYFGFDSGGGSDFVASLVMDKVGGYGLGTLQSVLNIKVSIADIRNTGGVVLQPTLNAIALTMLELAIDPIPSDQTSHDLTLPLSPNAWPLCQQLYMWIDTKEPVTTCAAKRHALSFVMWIYQSSSAKLLAEALNMAIVPELFLTRTDLIHTLETTVLCQGSRLISSETRSGAIEGTGAGAMIFSAFSNYYQTVEGVSAFTYRVSSERISTQRVVAKEIDLSLVVTRQLSPVDIELMTQGRQGKFVPAFLTGVVITFALPTLITAKAASWTSASPLPSLYPLALDLETVAGIFAGQIKSWTDEAILATSPQLAKYFEAVPNANPLFTTIVCCSSAADRQVAGQLLLQGLNNTALAKQKDLAPLFALPLSWTRQLQASTSFTLIDTETRVLAKTSAITAVGSSVISYRLMDTAVSNQATEFRIVQTVDGVTEAISPEPAQFAACATAAIKTGKLETASMIEPVANCYPLTSTLSIGVNLAYEGEECFRGNRSLNFFSWMTNSKSLSSAALSSGMMLLASIDSVRTSQNAILNSATCDGETLLITLPLVWKVNAAISDFGTAIFVIGLIVFATSGVLLWFYRQRTVLRSSSVPFLAVTLLGLVSMISSVQTWTDDVNANSCTAFMWTASLGCSLIFVPFFAKTWRSQYNASTKILRFVVFTRSLAHVFVLL